VKHVGIIFNPDSAPFAIPIAEPTVAAAPKFELKADRFRFAGPIRLRPQLFGWPAETGGGLICLPDPTPPNLVQMLIVGLMRTSQIARGLRLKLMWRKRLLSYGTDLVEIFRDALATSIASLRARSPLNSGPATDEDELVINLKRARAIDSLSLRLLLVRADDM